MAAAAVFNNAISLAQRNHCLRAAAEAEAASST
jgi:hypothetical protein